MATVELTSENFESVVTGNDIVVVDFWAPWCGPCKSLGPVLEKLETDYAGRFILAKLDADKVPQIAGQLSQMLEEQGIHVARRTVAKYREALVRLTGQS